MISIRRKLSLITLLRTGCWRNAFDSSYSSFDTTCISAENHSVLFNTIILGSRLKSVHEAGNNWYSIRWEKVTLKQQPCWELRVIRTQAANRISSIFNQFHSNESYLLCPRSSGLIASKHPAWLTVSLIKSTTGVGKNVHWRLLFFWLHNTAGGVLQKTALNK